MGGMPVERVLRGRGERSGGIGVGEGSEEVGVVGKEEVVDRFGEVEE